MLTEMYKEKYIILRHINITNLSDYLFHNTVLDFEDFL